MAIPPTSTSAITPAPTAKTLDYYQYLTEHVIAGTRGARFTSARLLMLKERASLLIQSVLAILLIWVSVLLLTYPDVSKELSTKLGIVSTMSSVAILAITLFEYALGRGLLASKLHDSSLRATALMRKLERELASPQPSLEALALTAEEYEQENILTNVNHSTFDFTLHKWSRAKSKRGIINFFYRVRSIVAQFVVVGLAVSPGVITLVVIMYHARGLPLLGTP